MENKRIEGLKFQCRMFVNNIENCLKDDFKHFHRVDIRCWQKELNRIREKSDKIPIIKEGANK